MNRSTRGFTMIEMVIAILIGSILVSIALSAAQGAQTRFAVRNAKSMYATLHQRARAMAIERGQTVLFQVDVAGDSAWLWSASTGITGMTRFRSELNVDLRAPSNYLMCMTPRGYSDYNCGGFAGMFTATTNAAIKLEFWMNADSTSVMVLPMGQLVGM